MNLTYKDSNSIKKIINTIIDAESMWGKTPAKNLEGVLNAVAEVAFIAGQQSINSENLNLKFELDLIKTENQKLKRESQDYYNLTNGREIENGIQKIKDGYNELQAFLRSPNRIK